MSDTTRRIVLSGVLALGLGSVILGFAIGKTGGDAQGLPEGVEAVSPHSGDKVQRQTEVNVDLAPGYDGTLVIDSTEVPPDQITYDAGQNLLIFPCRLSDTTQARASASGAGQAPTAIAVPGHPPCARATPGVELVELPKGTVRITVKYWKIGEQESTTRSYFWSFTTF